MDREEFKKLYPDNDSKYCYSCEFDKPLVYKKPYLSFNELQDYLLKVVKEAEEQGIDLFPTVRNRIY